VVPAAGSGARMGGELPKQYLQLHGRSILDWSVSALLALPGLRGCVVTLPQDDVARAREGVLQDPRVSVCAGGASRAESVLRGLTALPAIDGDWVMVHDAARPCLAKADLERLVGHVLETGVGALLARPVSDTLKRCSDTQRVSDTVDREGLWSAQTPQMFEISTLRAGLADAARRGLAVTDEASAMQQAGHPVDVVEGAASNLKVTYAEDLELASLWLGRRSGAHAKMCLPGES